MRQRPSLRVIGGHRVDQSSFLISLQKLGGILHPKLAGCFEMITLLLFSKAATKLVSFDYLNPDTNILFVMLNLESSLSSQKIIFGI